MNARMHFDNRLQMAYRHIQLGQLDLAETALKQILAMDSNRAGEASAALAELYSKQQRYDLAIEVLDAACSNDPNDAKTLARLANIYKNWGKFEEAKEYKLIDNVLETRIPAEKK